MFQDKISKTKQIIENLKGQKSGDIAGTVFSSIFLPLTFGLSNIGISSTTIKRSQINAKIKQYESYLSNYQKEINE